MQFCTHSLPLSHLTPHNPASPPRPHMFPPQLLTLCDSEDIALAKLPCYRSVPSLVPLKVSGLAALAACHYLPEMREKIFTVLYKAIHSSVKELQEAGKDAMKKVCVCVCVGGWGVLLLLLRSGGGMRNLVSQVN